MAFDMDRAFLQVNKVSFVPRFAVCEQSTQKWYIFCHCKSTAMSIKHKVFPNLPKELLLFVYLFYIIWMILLCQAVAVVRRWLSVLQANVLFGNNLYTMFIFQWFPSRVGLALYARTNTNIAVRNIKHRMKEKSFI
jgi:hypothetical protein